MENQTEQTIMLTPEMEKQSESLKLIKNTKGFSWEIRILSLDVDRIESLNKEMIKRFGVAE